MLPFSSETVHARIRGFDLSNMTIIEGDNGIIVIDPLISTEVARAGLELYQHHRGHGDHLQPRHADHHGGVRGVVGEEDVRAKAHPNR